MKSEPLVNKKFCRPYVIANVQRKQKKIRESKSTRNRKNREKIRKINVHKSVKATGARKRLKYSIDRETINDAPEVKEKKVYEFEPHFCSSYERESQKCQQAIIARTWSTTAVKSIEFGSLSSGFQTCFPNYHKGNKS